MATYYNVYSGKTSTGLTANAKDVFICVSKGGTAEKANVSDGGEMVVYSGGIAISSFIHSHSILNISKGGLAVSTTVSGGIIQLSGGKASASYIKPNGVLHVSKGGSAVNISNSGGIIHVSSGGIAKLTTVGNNGSVFVYSGGVTSETNFFLTKGSMFVSGGKTYGNRLTSGGWLGIYSGGLASDNVLSGGSMIVSSGGKAVGTDLQKNAVARVYYGGVVKDTKVNIYFDEGGELHISNGGMASNTTTYWLTNVSAGGMATKTTVAGGSMVVLNGGSAAQTTVAYGKLILSLGGMATKTTVSSGSMVVSSRATATGNTVGSAGLLYVSLGGTATKTTINGGFMGVFSSGTANSITGMKARIEVSAGASMSNVVLSGGTMFISKGATVTNLTNKGADIRVEKGAIVSNCKGNPLEFADRDGGWNDYEKGETPAGYYDVKVENIPDSTKKIALDSDGSVSMNGMINFVGYEDEYDYAKIKLNNAANLSFKVEATGKAKFTIWRWDGSKMISVQSAVLKKDAKTGLFTVTTKKCLLEKENEYYISVQALNVKTGGFAYYNVYLNREDDNCIFYNRCDDSENYWMVDSNKDLNTSSDVPTRTLSPGESKTLQVDVTALNYKKTWNNFVGHNDDTDYAKIKVTQNLKTSFTVEATDAAKFTVYQIVNNSGKYSLKSIQTKALKKQKDGTFKATLSNVTLKSGNDYCVCMTSINAKKGGNAYYNVTYTAVSADTAALTGPEEEEANGWSGIADAADSAAVSDILADAGFLTLSGADLAGMQMSGAGDPVVSPIPVAASDDLFAGLADTSAGISGAGSALQQQDDSQLTPGIAMLA